MLNKKLAFLAPSLSHLALLLLILLGLNLTAKPASAACETSWQACADGCLASMGLPPGDSGARAYCSTHGGLGAYACDDNAPPTCQEPPAPCNNTTTTSSQYCPSGYQTGSVTVQTTYNCYGSVVGQTSSDNCGCMSGYSWNGSTCAANPPPTPTCPPSTVQTPQNCPSGYQTGSVTVTTRTYSDCSTSQSESDTCGCYNGYSWNGYSCVANPPPQPSCSPSVVSSPPVSCSAYGYQTGTITTTTRTYSDCSTSQSESGSCGCYSGYSWNGSYCEADAIPEDGSCGGSVNSCASGSFSDVTDSAANYLWNCYGVAGGSSTGCAQAKPGKCGSAHTGTYSSSPHSSSALCALGTASAVAGSSTGPWAWTCATAGGTANCTANYCAPPINGSCNTSLNNGCSAGDLVDLADSTTNYLWQCKGLNGGTDSPQCSKAKPPVVGGVCGGSLNTCTSGAVNDTADDSSNYNWQCLGSNGGANANCTYAKNNTICNSWQEHYRCTGNVVWYQEANSDRPLGSLSSTSSSAEVYAASHSNVKCISSFKKNFQWANSESDSDEAMVAAYDGGITYNPSTAGQASNSNPYVGQWAATCNTPPSVNGSCGSSNNSCNAGSLNDTADNSSNYRWQCVGSNGGSSVNCSLAKPQPAENGSCGSSNNSCNAGSLSDTADSSSYYNWNCVGSNGGSTANCSTPKPSPVLNGSCGSSNNSCNQGSLNDTSDTSTSYLWQCMGENGGSSASCSQAKPVNGSCGSSNNSCNYGSLSDTPDSGSYSLWDCVGSNGGSTASCSQIKTVRPLNGLCGSGNNSCDAGFLNDTADSSSQYLWSCTGMNGGTTASCSENKPVNGSCGSSNNSCNAGSLSDTADSSSNYLWNCVGSNGGSTASCSAAKPTQTCTWQTTGNLSCGSQHFNLTRGSDCSAILGFGLGGSCSGSRSCDYGSWEGDGAPYGTCPTGTNRVYHGTVSCVCQ